MSFKKNIGQFLRDKLGVTETREDLSSRVRFLSAYVNVMLPGQVHLDQEVLRYAEAEIRKRYAVEGFNPMIHKNDLMFQHHLRKMPERAPEAIFHYFNVGLDALSKIREVTGNPAAVKKLLDFGAGYGRGSRFLPFFYSAAEISVSEVKGQALRFQQEVFGYKPVSHSEDPGTFRASKYDLILAISVFSHLPEKLFTEWLKKLYTCLNPGAQLIFTFNNIKLHPTEEKDYLFITQSEDQGMGWVSDRIERSDLYGSAFYSNEKITAIIREATGTEPEIIENFSGQQDAVVIKN